MDITKICDWEFNHSIEVKSEDTEWIEILFKRYNCHHYTTLDSFWKIISSETFRATHVRFSNDMQEYLQGEETIKKIIKSEDVRKEDYYVICFCKEDNLLSQWREYGQVGVSIEMDFSRPSVYSILKTKTKETPDVTDDHYCVYSCPIDVLYSFKNDNNFINVNTSPKSKFTFDQLKQYYESRKDQSDFSLSEQLCNIIPYIKNNAFEEEKEARLLFSLPKAEAHCFVRYADSYAHQKPYYSIQYGDISKRGFACEYIDIGKDVDSNVISILEENYTCLLEGYGRDVPQGNNIYISAGNNQDAIYYNIENLMSNLRNKPKIWCDGHWPIRSITVGPTLDEKQIKESIEHYCENHYWMKSIQVKESYTPYREKRK